DGAFYLWVRALEDDAQAFSDRAKAHELLLVPSGRRRFVAREVGSPYPRYSSMSALNAGIERSMVARETQ
ncbi:hypothetical protein NE582_06890, partial [Gordonibacter pamelaeae]|nr:hypothetical protein [Gordonibacter pamelaeae]